MSAYIVEDSTINRIVTWIAELPDRNSGPLRYLGRSLPIQLPIGCERREAAEKLARDLLSMNIAAVHARYGEADSMMPDEPFTFAWEHSGDEWQLLKSLTCYLYQCSEGDVPQRELFKQLDTFRAQVAEALATSVPQYQEAQWA